ncbi:hypothetical protein CLIB1444_02S17150 [[Candida] jaroonii]|uniref:Uncharacterized protein n=1 Tax=[Candida] jaroonii TaxID=467808 RepID=A0ACA9Y4A7_9ASCO|nr:hypothetical protein CLIB1444_02S17150 [[Candida] jaroonii]
MSCDVGDKKGENRRLSSKSRKLNVPKKKKSFLILSAAVSLTVKLLNLEKNYSRHDSNFSLYGIALIFWKTIYSPFLPLEKNSHYQIINSKMQFKSVLVALTAITAVSAANASNGTNGSNGSGDDDSGAALVSTGLLGAGIAGAVALLL